MVRKIAFETYNARAPCGSLGLQLQLQLAMRVLQHACGSEAEGSSEPVALAISIGMLQLATSQH